MMGMILTNTRMEADRLQDKVKRMQQIQTLQTKNDLQQMAQKMV
jgi:hypothetical protein